jgi:hypothetical protein
MASSSTPRIVSFKAGAAIAKGKAVKFGADDEHVIAAAAATDGLLGVAQNAADAAEDIVEVAIPGGGAKGLAQGNITRGALLTSHTDGTLKAAAASGDRIVGQAMASAVAGDLFPVEVQIGTLALAA